MSMMRALQRVLWLLIVVPMVAHAASSSSSSSSSPSSSVPTRLYALHVGVNDAPTGATTLRFADDDAARFYRFSTEVQGATAMVATIVDDESLRRHGDVAARAIVPDTQSLVEALEALSAQMAADRAAGHVVAFSFSYSGHGVDDGSGQVGLTLLDGVADQAWLVEHVLSVPADRIHLFIDACHAAGVVTGRGVIAREVEGSAHVVNDDGVRQFLRRHPHAGALFASPRGDVTHEWSRLQAGVFTHEVLSALSGAADVNNDGRVVYSEVAAFLAAANRDVVDERARLRAEVVAPRLDPRTVLSVVEPSSSTFVLSGRALSGHVVIEQADGLRLVDVHSDNEAFVQVSLPANAPLVVKNNHQVALLQSSQSVRWDELRFVDDSSDDVGERGVANALAEGLFAAPFGRAYYIGYVDSRGLPAEAFSSLPGSAPAPAITAVPVAAIAGFAVGGVGLVGAVGAGLWALQEYRTATTSPYQRPAAEAAERFPIAVGAVGLGAAIAVAGSVVGGLSVP